MSSSAHVKSFAQLADLVAGLRGFGEALAQIMQAVLHEMAHLAEELWERERHCQRESELAQEELRRGQREFELHSRSEPRLRPEGEAAAAVWQAKMHWHAAQAELAKVQRLRVKIVPVIAAFKQHARQLSGGSLPAAVAFLNQTLAKLQLYLGEALPEQNGVEQAEEKYSGNFWYQLDFDFQVYKAAEFLSHFEEIKPQVWLTLSLEQRVHVLQRLEYQMSIIQNRPTVPVELREMPSPNFKGYTYGQTIYLNLANVRDSAGEEAILNLVLRTLLHEGRHVYQIHAILHLGFSPDAKMVAIWEHNFKNYHTAVDDFEDYWRQPVEVDARTYAGKIIDYMFEKAQEY